MIPGTGTGTWYHIRLYHVSCAWYSTEHTALLWVIVVLPQIGARYEYSVPVYLYVQPYMQQYTAVHHNGNRNVTEVTASNHHAPHDSHRARV